MNKSIIGLVLILASGLASAACPDISGKWGYQATEVLGGNQFAAIGRGTFRDNGTWTMRLFGALEARQPGRARVAGGLFYRFEMYY